MKHKVMQNMKKNLTSLIALAVFGAVLSGCPQNGRQNDNPEVGSLGDRSLVQFEVPSTTAAYSELAAMPYAIAKTYYDNRPGLQGKTMLALFIYESPIQSGVNPCLGENHILINQQPQQRAFVVTQLDAQIQSPQIVYNSQYSYNSGFWGVTPFVQFQLNDSVTGRSTIVGNFSGSITVSQYDLNSRTVLVNFDNLRSSYYGCSQTSQNQGLSCGARISGQMRIGLCF